jgi:N-acetylglucosaminyl-diphospho-decaprenol L-rhamnosyltransferase
LSAATDDRPEVVQSPDVTIIVVTWNCAALALRCLAEIHASRMTRDFEVIVIDNASIDGTAEQVASAFPATRLIVNDSNAGYARANNQGIRVASGRILMLLNPDAFPTTPDTFAALMDALDESDFAALGCRLVHADGRHQVGDAGWRPTPWHVVVHGMGLARILPGTHGLFLVRPERIARTTIDVDWVCGACLLVRADVARRHGGLDERFFMYAEDVEFGCRLRDHGLRVGYLPGQVVMHLQGGTQVDPDTVSTRWLDSLARLYGIMNGGRHWFAFRVALAGGFLLRALSYRAMAQLPGRDSLAGRARIMARYSSHIWRLRPP